jgi:hypothetical protein
MNEYIFPALIILGAVLIGIYESYAERRAIAAAKRCSMTPDHQLFAIKPREIILEQPALNIPPVFRTHVFNVQVDDLNPSIECMSLLSQAMDSNMAGLSKNERLAVVAWFSAIYGGVA